MSDPFDQANKVAGTVKTVMDLAKDSPELQQAGVELAKTALALTKAVNVCLLPVAAVNFGFDRAKKYFENQFESDIREKMAGVPEERIVEPPASVAGPTLQGLAFTCDEKHLKEMYLSLLAKAMDSESTDSAHPAFAEVIKQISAKEAMALRFVLSVPVNMPIVQIRKRAEPNTFEVVLLHFLPKFVVNENGESVNIDVSPNMVDNWARLGLVSVSYDQHIASEEAYNWVKLHPGFTSQVESVGKENIYFQKGVLWKSDFGKQFASLVF
ncbi:MAG: DUF4393 domain-containing protein [Pararhodobacter sp.]